MQNTAMRDHLRPEAGMPASVSDVVPLTQQQVEYFRTFGFLVLPGLFKADADRLIEGFDDVFAREAPDLVLTDDPLQQTDNPTFDQKRRRIIIPFIDRSENLAWLGRDPRVLGVVTSILGTNYEPEPTDGHIFDCDTSWHRDYGYGSRDEAFRLKLSFYLDAQRADSGAIRVIPGSHHHEGAYARRLLHNAYGNPKRIRDNYGMEPDQIPCWAIASDPGDLICWDYRTVHASFHGFKRRRLLSMTFREVVSGAR